MLPLRLMSPVAVSKTDFRTGCCNMFAQPGMPVPPNIEAAAAVSASAIQLIAAQGACALQSVDMHHDTRYVL